MGELLKIAEFKKEESYQPLSSVWFGEDHELLKLMLEFYPRQKPRIILDATINKGRFWLGNNHPVIGLDINRSTGLTWSGIICGCLSGQKLLMSWFTIRLIFRTRERTGRRIFRTGSG